LREGGVIEGGQKVRNNLTDEDLWVCQMIYRAIKDQLGERFSQ
jgi:hypothetical protein